ncbi:hypothetical protein [Nocardioides sp. zg-1230]|uniref:hypothetical protein n=1 Tax=Nocardioides sp. zg-1230 TaxID=2736601 RepID=UPI001554C2EB|nr:hypothetical protein [Nocardioides sp. zg-1230]NPC42613.1 hypothetical protein [Nocardioides sp. zg-1230]
MSSPSDLEVALAALEAELLRLQAPLVHHWQPGAEPGAVTGQLATCGAEALPDLLAWFGWHDGTGVSATTPPGAPWLSDDTCLFGVWHLPTLGQAAVLHHAALALEDEAGVIEALGTGWYKDGWFPVLVALDGWLVCVDTIGTAGPVGSLFVWDTHAANDPFDLRPWYPSLTGMVAAMVAAYRSGRITPTQGYIELEDLPPESRPLAY